MSNIDTAKERKELAGLAGFTPGPWKDWQPRSDESVPVRTDGLGITIAYIHQGAVTNARNNARLIAAAPDLKATLTAALDALDAKDAVIEELRALMRSAHAVMRECGWQLAPDADYDGFGILEIAASEVEAEFRAALNPEKHK